MQEIADWLNQLGMSEYAQRFTADAVKIFMPAGAKKPVYAPYREHVPGGAVWR